MGAKLKKLKESLHTTQRGLGKQARSITGVAALSALTILSSSCKDKSLYEKASDDYIEISQDLQDLKEERVDKEQERVDIVNDIKIIDQKIREKTIEYNDAKRRMKEQARKE